MFTKLKDYFSDNPETLGLIGFIVMCALGLIVWAAFTLI